MTQLMKTVLILSLSGTLLAAGLALLRRALKNRLPHGLFYYLWLLVLLRLMVPVALPVPGLERVMEPPAVEIVAPPPGESAPSDVEREPVIIAPGDPQTVPGQTVPGAPGQTVPVETPGARVYEQVWDFLCENFTALWLAGAAVHFLWFSFSYLRFCRSLRAGCVPLWEHEQALLDDLRGDIRVEACRSPLAGTPMLVGLLRPRIILPENEITTLQLECILRHELTHLRRRDLLYKWFAVAVTSFHWFNPLMPWLRREISRCCELSCDEAVIGPMNDDQKRTYGETLLALAAANALPRAVPATTLCEEKKQLKERLVGILKHKHATAVILLLSCLLALLVAGCAAVLGPQNPKDTFTGPLTEEQQAPVMENIRVWAAENLKSDSEPRLTYSLYHDKPQGMGWGAMYANGCWLYDLHTGGIRAVDGTYADTAQLGMVLAQGEEDGKNRAWVFYLTNGEPTDGADPILRLEQIAAEYPNGRVSSLTWWRQEDKGIYMTMHFLSDGKGYTCEYSSVTGVVDVLPDDRTPAGDVSLPLDGVPGLLDNIFRWQTEQDTPHNGQNYSLDLAVNSRLAEILVDSHSQVAVHNLSTGEMTRLEGDYTGSLDYGCVTVLGPAKSPFWLYLIDDTVKPSASEKSGRVAVLTQNASLDNAFAQTVDEKGNPIVMDMAVTLRKGDLVWVESQDGATCNVTVLAGEPPRVQGQLDASLLSTEQADLENANQVILNNAPQWSAPNESASAGLAVSGVANVEERRDGWYCVTLPGGDAAFWARQQDTVFVWPLPEPIPVWLPAEADPAAKITGWTYGESNGQPQIVILEVEDPPAHRAWAWDMRSGTMVERTARNTRKAGDLTVGQLPGVLKGLKGWLDENEPVWQADRTVTFIYQPPTGYGHSFSKEETVLVYSLADGRVTKPEGDYTGSENYGLLDITVNGSKTNLPYYLVIDDAPTADPVPDLAGKVFVYENEGFGSDFTIKLHADGTFGYYEGMLSSHIGMGTWDVEGNILTLHEDTFDRTFRFRVQDGDLHFLREGSDQFLYIKVADGARFLENVQATATLQAFSQVLWNAYLKGELPQGENLDWRSVEAAAENHFTCTDIDGDGRMELLLSWTNASMAGHDFVIFDYRDGALYRTDLPFTSLRFYDNGAVEVDWSHSQGWSGRFWPYDVYLYNADTDDYAAFGSVEAWDKQLVSKGFPDDVDADGDGLVYEVRRAGEVLPNDRHYDRRRLMDGPAFEEWRQSYLNGAQEVPLELRPLTEDNIAALGAPKPVVHTVQPVG